MICKKGKRKRKAENENKSFKDTWELVNYIIIITAKYRGVLYMPAIGVCKEYSVNRRDTT